MRFAWKPQLSSIMEQHHNEMPSQGPSWAEAGAIPHSCPFPGWSREGSD